MMLLSLMVLLDHIAVVNDYDKDDLVWFANGAFLTLTLLCGSISIPNKHGSSGNCSSWRKAKATVWSFASIHFPDVLSLLLLLMC